MKRLVRFADHVSSTMDKRMIGAVWISCEKAFTDFLYRESEAKCNGKLFDSSTNDCFDEIAKKRSDYVAKCIKHHRGKDRFVGFDFEKEK